MTSYGGGQIIRLVSNLILTRMLFEEAFGLMALVSVFLSGLQLFSDIGIGPSIIQNERGDDEDFLNTAWTLQAGRGVILSVASLAGAAPFAEFYGEEQLRWLIPLCGLTALIAGLNSTRLFTVQRNLAMRELAFIEVGSALVGAVTMVVWAAVSPTVWALAWGGIASSLARMIASHVLLPGIRNRPRWDRDAVTRLITFGRWIFLSTLLTFIVAHSDRLIFGKLVPVGILGVYSIGAALAQLPQAALSHLAGQILFSVYSRVWNEDKNLDEVFHRMRWPVMVAGGWMLAGFMAGGQTIIDILYDQRYANAGWVVQFLSFAAWFAIVEATEHAAFMARGAVQWLVWASIGKLIGMVTLIPLGYELYGFPGAVAGYAGAGVVRYLVTIVGAQWFGLKALGTDLKATALLLVSTVATYFATTLTREAGVPVLLEAAMVFVMVTGFWAPSGLKVWRAFRQRSA